MQEELYLKIRKPSTRYERIYIFFRIILFVLVTAQALSLEILLAICYNENRRNTQCWGDRKI